MATRSQIVMKLGLALMGSLLAGLGEAAVAPKATPSQPTAAGTSAPSAQASVGAAAAGEAEGQPLRAGGDYLVREIDRLADGTFAITFTSVHPTGRFDSLRLTSDHIHVAVKVGQQLRLSAEIMAETGAAAEVAQLVLFMPQIEGRVPVWLLSNKASGRELNATRYLEMHMPQNDFIIM